MATTRWRGLWRRGRRIAVGTVEWSWLLALAVLRLGLSFVCAVAGLVLFVTIAHRVFAGATQAVDERVVRLFQEYQPPWFHEPVLWVTRLANGETIVFVSLVTIGWYAWRRRWGRAATVAIAIVGGWGLIETLKAMFDRPRPELRVVPEAGLSFPSGHAFFSLTMYGLLAYLLAREAPRRLKRLVWTAVFAIAIVVGLSRVLLAVHYPSDVLAGFCVAAFWLWGCLKLPNLLAIREWGEWRRDRLADLGFVRQELMALAPEQKGIVSEAASAARSPDVAPLPRATLWGAAVFGYGYEWVGARVPRVGRYALGALPAAAALRWVRGNEAAEPVRRLATVGRVLLTGSRPAEEDGTPNPVSAQGTASASP